MGEEIKCKIEGCDKKCYGLGYCYKHWRDEYSKRPYVIEKRKRYYQEHKEKIDSQTKEWFKKHPERTTEIRKKAYIKYRLKHGLKVKNDEKTN